MNRLTFLTTAIICFSLIPKAQAVTWDDVTMNGYFSFEYEETIGGDDEGDNNGSFDLDLIDLVFNIQATNNLRVATDLTWEHGAASEDGRGNVAVEYAFAEYTFDNLLRIKAGKMFTNFGIYNEIHTAKPANLTIKEPLSTNKNNKFGSEIRFYPRWQTGIAATGDGSMGEWDFDYDVQLSNGESEEVNPYEEDDNHHKAVTARIRISPNDNIRFGISAYDDSMEGLDGRIEISSYGAQFEWDSYDGAGVEIEYIVGDEDYTANEAITRSAYSAMVFYHVTDEVIPYLRHEAIDPNDDIDDDEATKTIVGVNWRFDQNMHLKLELDHIETEDNNDKFEGADFDEVKASISIGF